MFDAALAPVRGLSPDILLEIFDLCLPTKLSPRQRMKALLNLCHVTSSWRTVSLGAPMLWSSAFISLECSQISSGFGELEPSPYQASKESMLEEWFRRAGTTAPLYLVIEFRHTAPGTSMEHSPAEKSLTALVKPYATRIQHLRVTSYYHGEVHGISLPLKIMKEGPSLLGFVSRYNKNEKKLEQSHAPLLCFYVAPQHPALENLSTSPHQAYISWHRCHRRRCR